MSAPKSAMVFKKRKTYGRRPRKTYRKKALFRKPVRRNIARVVKNVLASRVEVKRNMVEVCKNFPMVQNAVANLFSNALSCDIGVHGTGLGGIGGKNDDVRVGNEIYAKGMQVSIMIEAQQYRPLTTFWLYLVKNIVTPDAVLDTKDEVFEGRSTLIPMDYIDTRKVKIIHAKKFTLRMPNGGVSTQMNNGAGLQDPPGTAFDVSAAETWTVKTNPQHIEKFYIPLKRKIVYRDSSDVGARLVPIGPQRYQWIAVAYDNYAANIEGGATPAGVAAYPIGHISLTTNLIFTDQ
nr:capsid protein [Mute swan feces associated circular virus 17]